MPMGLSRRRLWPRNVDDDSGTTTRLADETHASAQQLGALLHPQQADGPGVVNFHFQNASAIVINLHDKIVACFCKVHVHFGSAGVANDVRQRFLKDPEERSVQFLVPDRFPDARMDATTDAGLAFKFVCLPFERGRQAGAVQHSGTQLGGDPADCLNGGINVRGHRACLLVKRFRFFGQA